MGQVIKCPALIRGPKKTKNQQHRKNRKRPAWSTKLRSAWALDAGFVRKNMTAQNFNSKETFLKSKETFKKQVFKLVNNSF